MKTWLKAVLFFSSISPMFFILIIQNFNFDKFLQKQNAIDSIFFIKPVIAYILIGFVIVPNLILFTVLKMSQNNTPSTCSVASVSTKSGEVLNYFATYIIPLLSFKTDKINDILVFALLLVVLTIIYTYTNMFFINPVLILLRYQIVEVNHSIIIITRTRIRNGDTFYIYGIANNIFYGVKR